MKIAILIVGEYRTFSYCRKSWKFLDQILPDTEIDIFFSTWNVSRTENYFKNGITESSSISKIDISKEMIESCIKKNVTIEIHPFESKTNVGFDIMRKGWLLGMQLVDSANKNYDYLLVCRPDMFFEDAKFDIKKFSKYKQSIGFPKIPEKNDEGNYILQDTCFFSTYRNIKLLLNKNLWSIDQSDGGLHHAWYKYVYKKGLKFETLPFANNENVIARYPISQDDDYETVYNNYWNYFKKINHH